MINFRLLLMHELVDDYQTKSCQENCNLKSSYEKPAQGYLKMLLVLFTFICLSVQVQAQTCATVTTSGGSQARNGYPIPGKYTQIGTENGAPKLSQGINYIYFTCTRWELAYFDGYDRYIFYTNPSTDLDIPTTGWQRNPDEAVFNIQTVTKTECPIANITITGNSQTITSGSTSPAVANNTDFGLVAPGSAKPLEFIIENSGNSNLTFSSVTITGTDAGDFSVVSPASFTPVSASSSGGMTIQFAPTSGGLRSATVVINSNANDTPSYWFAIQGTGVCTDPVINPLPIGVLGPNNCSLNFKATVSGKSFVVTGQGGYTYSNVFRREGMYSITAPGITQPGTYFITAYTKPGCNPVVLPIVIQGVACQSAGQ